jgi:hypothetical protein
VEYDPLEEAFLADHYDTYRAQRDPTPCNGTTTRRSKLQARVALEELLIRQPDIGVDVAAGERVRGVHPRLGLPPRDGREPAP